MVMVPIAMGALGLQTAYKADIKRITKTDEQSVLRQRSVPGEQSPSIRSPWLSGGDAAMVMRRWRCDGERCPTAS